MKNNHARTFPFTAEEEAAMDAEAHRQMDETFKRWDEFHEAFYRRIATLLVAGPAVEEEPSPAQAPRRH